MRHVRFDIATLAVEEVPLPLRAGYLLVAEQPGADDLQWECLAYGFDDVELPLGTYRVDLAALDGRTFAGSAVLVRSVDGAHVLRGDGPLAGLAATDLG